MNPNRPMAILRAWVAIQQSISIRLCMSCKPNFSDLFEVYMAGELLRTLADGGLGIFQSLCYLPATGRLLSESLASSDRRAGTNDDPTTIESATSRRSSHFRSTGVASPFFLIGTNPDRFDWLQP